MTSPAFDTEIAMLAKLAQEESLRETVAALRANYRRRAWFLDPVVHLTVVPAEDALYAELSAAAGSRRQVVHDLLCVEFDGDDVDAMPLALCLEEFGRDPHSPAAIVARKVLGETVWRRALQLADDDAGELEATVRLSGTESASLILAWRELAVLPVAAIGVRLVPGYVAALVVDATTGKATSPVGQELTSDDEESAAQAIRDVVLQVLGSQNEVEGESRMVIGIEIGGPVNHETGIIEHYNKRALSKRWREVDLAGRVRELTGGIPTIVVNDAEALGALHVWESPGKLRDTSAVLYISEGIGSALIVNGRVDRRFPMEVGNVPLEPYTGPECSCGMRGCVEATAGLGAILSSISNIVGQKVSLAKAIDLAEKSDEVLDVFNRAGDRLALGMAASQYFVDPSRWVVFLPPELYAEKSRARKVFLRNLGNFARNVVWEGFKKKNSVEQRLGGPEEGAHGAGLAALDRFGVPVLEPFQVRSGG